jgi:hypothetical protein
MARPLSLRPKTRALERFGPRTADRGLRTADYGLGRILIFRHLITSG